MNDSAELTRLRELFTDHWPASSYPVLWENPGDAGLPVQPVGSRELPGFPATFVAIEIQYDSFDLVTSTTTEVRGRAVVSVWVEESAEEEELRKRLVELRAMFRDHGDVEGMQFLAGMVSDKAFPDEDAPWYGRAISFPFVRFDEAEVH